MSASTSSYAVSVDPVLQDGAATSAVADELAQVRVGPVLTRLAEALPGSAAAVAAGSLAVVLDARLQRVQQQVARVGQALTGAGRSYDGCEADAAATLGGGC